MKFLKYAVLILLVAVVTDMALVSAYSSQSGIGISYTLNGNTATYTQYMTKINLLPQTYRNGSMDTALTHPCSNCKLAVRAHNENGDMSSAITMVMGETKTFNSPTSVNMEGNYRLEIWRYDFTLLDTYHNGYWTINPVY